jgi:uncharacterized protein
LPLSFSRACGEAVDNRPPRENTQAGSKRRKAFHYIRLRARGKAQQQNHLQQPAPHLSDLPHTPLTVVLDTNAVLDWLLFADPRVAPLQMALECQALRWISTPAMRDELAEVLRRPPLCQRFANSEQVLQAFDHHSIGVEEAAPAPRHLQCRDSDDQKFIDLALAHGAAWLFTRDKALLELSVRARPLGCRILTPALWPGLPTSKKTTE